jgi:TDG/mug DNA glycosylase family protein
MPGAHHRVLEEWMGEQVETLEDLLRPGLRAVCIGINPAPASVAAGHYYQGTLGQRFYGRLRRAGWLTDDPGWEDDLAYASGIGFTDIVKRPTASASMVTSKEFAHGKRLLEEKLRRISPSLIIFSFKTPAELLLGRFSGNGSLGRRMGGADVFVMPGPYADSETVASRLAQLASLRD